MARPLVNQFARSHDQAGGTPIQGKGTHFDLGLLDDFVEDFRRIELKYPDPG